ncbi:hypothetical protein FNF28_03132 [Cafeteria roenbergensis]|uniref:Uncharacterized protein n=1 Tax=Cafeteria roenbergensis TaxID=33653 RepID=A0A5A8DRU0_CAFRO|nr:hypothetical protein FNF28_03132 [Cafeteria roenbergensis]
MAGVIEQANDVVTLLGLLASSVLLARKLIAKKSWAWALLPVGVVAVAGLVAVSDADTVNTLPPKGFWTGHEWLAAAVAAAAVLAAVAAEASSPGSSGSAVASSGTQAIQSAFSAAWESTQPLRDGAADFSRPYWHKLMATPMLGQRTLADAGTGLIVAQFGLLVTALLFGFLPAMAIVGATYFALDNVWGLPDPYAGVRAMPRI